MDARGRWFMRDEQSQSVASFQRACADPNLRAGKGQLLCHEGLLSFVARNYSHDGEGKWFFQNGPQRVYVELECAPWIWRATAEGHLMSTTGQASGEVHCALTDEKGRLFLSTELGLGMVHSLDMLEASEALEKGKWGAVESVAFADLLGRFGCVLSPQYQV